MSEIRRLITKMYCGYQTTEDYMRESKGHSFECDKMYKFIVEELQDNEKEEMLSNAIIEREDFAFFQGFKFALNFMRECEKM